MSAAGYPPPHSSVCEALHRELRNARALDRPVAGIRVTRDAIPGTVAALAVTPSRARVVGALAITAEQEGGVVAHPATDRLLEILMHPDDWRELMVDAGAPPVIGGTVLGLRVRRS